MTQDSATRSPPIKFAERDDSLFVTFSVPDCKDADIKLTEDALTFKGTE